MASEMEIAEKDEAITFTGTDKEGSVTIETKSSSPIHIGVREKVSKGLTFLLGAQITLLMVGSPLPAVYIIHQHVCAEGDDVFFAQLLSTGLFLNGIATAMQVALGVRLPVNVGMSFSYLPPIIAIMSAPMWKCPGKTDGSISPINGTLSDTSSPYFDVYNSSVVSVIHNVSLAPTVAAVLEPPWKPRIQRINGGLVLAAGVQILLGATGLAGFFMAFIGPLTVVALVGLLALSLFDSISLAMEQQWGVALLVAFVLIVQALLMKDVNVWIPCWSRKKKFYIKKFPVFRLFAGLIALGVGWLVCYILTVSNVLPHDPGVVGYKARTDAKLEVLNKTSWFFLPHPGQWGLPTFGVGSFLGMMTAVLADMVESMGVYYATASVCGVSIPPKHAINRGVVSEGICNCAGGLIGSTCGTGSFSSSVGFITVTGLASRNVWLVAALLLTVAGVIGKIGAAMSLVPDPVIGGMTLVSLGCLFSVAFTNLQAVNMKSARNIIVLGVSVLLGLIVPHWMRNHPDAIKTGNETADATFTVLLSNSMLVGGVLACFMDNVLPGSKEDRGLLLFHSQIGLTRSESSQPDDLYDIPFISNKLRSWRLCWYIPCMPSYRPRWREFREVPMEEARSTDKGVSTANQDTAENHVTNHVTSHMNGQA